jgi:hypothetical protein
MKSGMKCLIESFYRAIAEDTPPPIPYREILLTARIMDTIFAQLDTQLRTEPGIPISMSAPKAAAAAGATPACANAVVFTNARLQN